MDKKGDEDKGRLAKVVRAPLGKRQLRRKVFRTKWAKWDWSKANAVLADELGLSRERLRQIRKEIGAPKPARRRHRVRKSIKILQWAKDNLEKLKGASREELVQKYGLSRWQGSALFLYLKPFLRDGRRKHRWELINFDLPNCDLEQLWRLPPNMAGSYRFRMKRQRPAWLVRNGRVYQRGGGGGPCPAYHRARTAEERKAAKWFGSSDWIRIGGRLGKDPQD